MGGRKVKKSVVVLIALEYPPYLGGIANYSETMAKYFKYKGQPVSVITTNSESRSLEIEIIKPLSRGSLKGHWLVRKTFSAIYRLYQHVFIYKAMIFLISSPGNKRIIVTSLFFDLSWKCINFFVKLRIPFEIVLHGLDIFELSQKKPREFHKVLRKSHRVIVNSISTRKLFMSHFPNHHVPQVFHPLLDTDKIRSLPLLDTVALCQAFSLDKDAKWIISICRLAPRKGIDLAIEAVSGFLRSHQDWLYIIAGTGSQEDDLKNLIAPDLKKRILFLGPISDTHKFSLLNESEIFIMPNRDFQDDVEGFGISFIEATFMKNWVIGGDSGGVPEAVDTTSNGILIDTEADPVPAITRALNKIATLDTSRNEMLNMGRSFVENRFSIKNYKGIVDHELD